MGIDYYQCKGCPDCFPDCGSYSICGKCGSYFCSRCEGKQDDKYGHFEEDESGEIPDIDSYEGYYDIASGYLKSCDLCSLQVIDNSILIEFLLKKYKTTKKKAEKEIRENYTWDSESGLKKKKG